MGIQVQRAFSNIVEQIFLNTFMPFRSPLASIRSPEIMMYELALCYYHNTCLLSVIKARTELGTAIQ